MKKIHQFLWILLTVLICVTNSIGQNTYPLDISVLLTPPFPTNLEAYSEYLETGIFIVNNNTSEPVEAIFSASLKQTGGFSIELDGLSNQSIIFGPGSTILGEDEIEEAFAGLSDQDANIQGLSDEQRNNLLLYRQLPEGEYEICVHAFSEFGEPLSEPGEISCFSFTAEFPSRPEIMFPFNDQIFEDFEIINLNWIHNLTDFELKDRIEYELKLIDLTANNYPISQKQEAMFTPNVDAFEVYLQNLDNGYSLNTNDNEDLLEYGHTYAVKLKAIDPENQVAFQFGGHSEVIHFTFGTLPEEEIEDEDEEIVANDEGGCVGTTSTQLPTDQNDIEIEEQDEVKIGKFAMKINTISDGDEANGYTGEGEISVNFLAGASIKVAFSDLQVNKSNQVFNGQAIAMQDNGEISPMIEGVEHLGAQIPVLGVDGSAELRDAYMNTSKLVSALTGDEAVSLPLGWDRNIDGQEMVIGLSNMLFTPTNAELEAMFSMENPEWIELPSFAASQINFSPNGFDKGVLLYLMSDYNFSYGENQMSFRGVGDGAAQDSGCYILMDCNGFDSGRIQADLTFSRDIVLPDGTNGSIGDGQVVANLKGDLSKGNQYVLSGSISAFQVPGLAGFSWEVEEAVFDQSDIQSPFDENMADSDEFGFLSEVLDFENEDQANTWEGLYIQRFTMQTPADWALSEDRLALEINHLIIDEDGLTTGFEQRGILNKDEGSFDGWAMSLDTFKLQIVRNTFEQSSIHGQIGLPILEKGEGLAYQGTLQIINEEANDNVSDDFVGITFSVEPDEQLTVPALVANIELRGDSKITFKYSKTEKSISAILNGVISINENILPEDVASLAETMDFNIPGLGFEGFLLSTKEGITAPDFSLAAQENDANEEDTTDEDAQGSINGIPINADPSEYSSIEGDDNGITFTIKPKLSLVGDKDGLTASAEISFVSSMDNGYYTLQSVNPESMTVGGSISGFSFDGDLSFYNEDDYKGVKGNLAVGTPAGMDVQLATEFGAYKEEGSSFSDYGSSNYYSYWQAEGLIKLAKGVPIGTTGQGLYGFGGGAYYNMTIDNDQAIDLASITPSEDDTENEETANPSGLTFSPQAPQNKGDVTLGLSASVIIGLYEKTETFFADGTLGIEFTTNEGTGLDISLSTNAYFLTGKGCDPANAKVTAKGDININVSNLAKDPELVFHGKLDTYVNMPGVISGAGNDGLMVEAEMHFETENPKNWYVFMGKPQKEDVDERGKLRIHAIPSESKPILAGYFMIGPGLSNKLPSMPEEIDQILSGEYPGYKNKTEEASNNGNAAGLDKAIAEREKKQTLYDVGKGVAFGLQFYYNMDETYYDFVHVNFGATAGFDIAMVHNENTLCDGSPIGINGWYATGQVYAGIWGSVDVHVDLWFVDEYINIFQASAALAVKGGGPNPTWVAGKGRLNYNVLDGLVKGSIGFAVDFGSKCDPTGNSPFGDIAFIDELSPKNGDKEVSVYTDFDLTLLNELREYKFRKSEDPEHENYNKWNRLEPYIHTFKVFETAKPNNIINGYYKVKKQDGLQFTWITNGSDEFKENTFYTVQLEIRARDLNDNNKDLKVFNKNFQAEVWKEFKSNQFKIGVAPDKIDDQVVNLTYPIIGQKYHLKNHGDKGFMKLKSALHSSVINKSNDKQQLIAKYTEISSGNSTESVMNSIKGNYQYISYNKPSLNNEQVYLVEIIRRTTIENSQTGETKEIVIKNETEQDTANIKAFDVVSESTVKTVDKVMYQYYFGTSKFNTYKEKVDVNKEHIGVLRYANRYISNGGYYDYNNPQPNGAGTWVPDYKLVEVPWSNAIKVDEGEPFDKIDLEGFTKNGRRQFPPLIEFQELYKYGYAKSLNESGGAYYDFIHGNPNGESWSNSNVQQSWREFRDKHDKTFPWETAGDPLLKAHRIQDEIGIGNKAETNTLSLTESEISSGNVNTINWDQTTIMIKTDLAFVNHLVGNKGLGEIGLGENIGQIYPDKENMWLEDFEYYEFYKRKENNIRMDLTMYYRFPTLNANTSEDWHSASFHSEKFKVSF